MTGAGDCAFYLCFLQKRGSSVRCLFYIGGPGTVPVSYTPRPSRVGEQRWCQPWRFWVSAHQARSLPQGHPAPRLGGPVGKSCGHWARLSLWASGTLQGDAMPSGPRVLCLQGLVKGFGQAGGQGTASQEGTRERTGPCVWSHAPPQAVTLVISVVLHTTCLAQVRLPGEPS